MIEVDAAERFASLGHPARLTALRVLLAAGPQGLAAGTLAERMELAPSATSFHLSRLRAVGLVERFRQGRELRYVARFEAVGELLGFLRDTCCSASPAQRCGPVCGAEQALAVAAGEHTQGGE